MLPWVARGWVALAHRASHAATAARPRPAAATPLRPILLRPVATVGVADSSNASTTTITGTLPPNAGHPAAAADVTVAAMLSTEPERQRQLARAAKRLERLQTVLPADGMAPMRSQEKFTRTLTTLESIEATGTCGQRSVGSTAFCGTSRIRA